MCLFDIVEFPDSLDGHVNSALFGHVEQLADIGLKRLLVARDDEEGGRLVGPEIQCLEQQLDHGEERRADLAGKRREVGPVGDEDAPLSRGQDIVGLVEALEAQGIEDGVHTPNLLHGADPVLVGVEEGMGAGFFEGGVVPLRGSAVDSCALEEAEMHEALAHSSAHAVDEDALAGRDFCAAVNHAVGGGPVEREGDGLPGINALGNGHEVLLRDVDVLGIRVILGQGRDQVAGLELGAAGAVDGDAAGEAVAGGERSGFLHGIQAKAHVDVGTSEARVEDLDLDMALGGGRKGSGDDLEAGGGRAVGGDDDFAVGDGHFQGWGDGGEQVGVGGVEAWCKW